jgi:nucleotide-binding universal stress UspA family protein
MHPIKAKRLKRVAKELSERYPTVAAELEQLVAGAMNPPHRVQSKSLNDRFHALEASVQDAVKEVVETLQGEDFVLAGGFAVASWIDIRKTYDADFVVLGPTFVKLDELFPGGTFKPLIYTVKLHGEDVDFLQPDLFPWTQDAIHAAATKDFMGQKMKVLTPEYLILYKFQAGRDKDFSDIKALLTLPGIPEKAEALVARYIPEEMEDFKQLVMEAEFGL